jgi:uncharacterized membrane protein YccC
MNALTATLPRQLSEWHEGRAAARMLVAALVAYVSTTMIHLPGPYSAVITTLIVARPDSQGVLRASLERLLATLLGAGIACAATFGRLVHLPELLLIAVALAPLSLIVAHNSGYRTAMIAAIIVLSAPASGGAPLHVAGVRMLGVSLGAVIGALVSITILPLRREVLVARRVAELLTEFVPLLRSALNANALDALKRDKLEMRVRQSVRELFLLVRDRPDRPPTRGPAAAMVKFTIQMNADIAFLKRELQTDESLPAAVKSALESFAQAFEDAATKVSILALRRPGPPPDIQALRDRCRETAQILRDQCPNSEGSRLMLRRLLEDFSALTRSLQRGLDPASSTSSLPDP